MNTPALIWLAVTVLAIAAALLVLRHRRKKAARTSVTAECLVCTYEQQFGDVTAALAHGNAHGDETGHQLILVAR